ncbi:hypothetical protein NECAME_17209 [Necator americanus]|uniref:Uncharacterized protein n=1 Tax=Necator americanus TaxID=51031 RepID=W2TRB2_NECAM|nr:hypothetical protein NECAME_17209 [Necator americanus]ETN84209.1 hypothetical protein NECAME_17209 [Necator americanus]
MTDKIVEQPAKEMPEMKNVKLRMTNLHLHANGVFSNVKSHVSGVDELLFGNFCILLGVELFSLERVVQTFEAVVVGSSREVR